MTQLLTAASLHDFPFGGKKLEGASGRGVGGGAEDAPICEIVKSIARSFSESTELENNSSLDPDSILEIADNNRIHVAPDTFFTDKSKTYKIKNGDIYLNSIYWSGRIHEEGYEEEVVLILIEAIDEKEYSDNVTEHYGERIRRNALRSFSEYY